MQKNTTANDIISGTKNSSVLMLLRYIRYSAVSAASMQINMTDSIHGASTLSSPRHKSAVQLVISNINSEIIRAQIKCSSLGRRQESSIKLHIINTSI